MAEGKYVYTTFLEAEVSLQTALIEQKTLQHEDGFEILPGVYFIPRTSCYERLPAHWGGRLFLQKEGVLLTSGIPTRT